MKKILFYEKNKGGHRDYILSCLRENLKTDNFLSIYYNASAESNSLTDISQMLKKENIDHVHFLTFDDCIEDFFDSSLVNDLYNYKITMSGNLFRFSILHSRNFLYETEPGARKKIILIDRLFRKNIISKLAIPDERIKNRFLYPFWGGKIVYLPDFPRFQARAVERISACRFLGLDAKMINFLFFGEMKEYKGLNLIADLLNKNLLHPDKIINLIIAGKNGEGIKFNCQNEKIKFTEFNEFIDENKANLLISAADCVLLPYKKDFQQSSGTFPLAAQYGKFFIVPEKGYLGYLVKKYNCGYSFKADDANSLAMSIIKFINNKNKLILPITGSLNFADKCKLENYIEILKRLILDCFNNN